MTEDRTRPERSIPAPMTEVRDWVAVSVRHRRWMALSFAAVLLGVAIYIIALPPRYASNTKILVKRERADLLVTANPSGVQDQIPPAITDTDLNSEVELIGSQDLLEAVAEKCGLQSASGTSIGQLLRLDGQYSDDPKLSQTQAVRGLRSRLTVEPLPKTSLISITYEDTDPQRAALVLNTLTSLYLEKHLAVHSPAGTLEFFRDQTEHYQQELKVSEARLAAFGHESRGVSPEQQKNQTLQKLADFQADLKQTQASIAETQERLRNLDGQVGSISSRMTTQVRMADNPQLIEQLKSTLLTLELKRTELLQKFEPTYRLVQEVDTQISQTQAAIKSAEQSKLTDETTDRNPVYEWVSSEQIKARAELASEQARAEALSRSVHSYEEQASQLDQQQVAEAGLLRDKNADEANYLLYLRKQEEARISDELDRSRIVNVTVTQAPEVPASPAKSRSMTLLVGLLAALTASLATAIAAEYLSPSLKNPEDVKEFLDLPVLGSISAFER